MIKDNVTLLINLLFVFIHVFCITFMEKCRIFMFSLKIDIIFFFYFEIIK